MNAGDNATLIVNNGTLDASANLTCMKIGINVGTGTGTVQMVNSGKLYVTADFAEGRYSTILVDGSGSLLRFNASQVPGLSGSLIVTNGGYANWTAPNGATLGAAYSYFDESSIIVTGVGSTNQMSAAVNALYYGGQLKVLDGGVFVAGGAINIGSGVGANSFPVATVAGSGTQTSVLQGATLALGDLASHTRSPELIVNAAGIARATATSGNAILLDDNSTLTFGGGKLQLGGGSTLRLQEFVAGGNKPLLRGSGTIERNGGAGNFTIFSDGDLKPGDTNATMRLGTLSISNGNLIQTNATGRIYFQFSDTGLDQITLSLGSATIGGTNRFDLLPGTTVVPTNGVPYGLRVYDFVIAPSITYTATDNLTNLLTGTYGLVYGADYRYGVMDIGGGLQALRLEFVPEPSTVLLLVGGGLVLWRFRRSRRS